MDACFADGICMSFVYTFTGPRRCRLHPFNRFSDRVVTVVKLPQDAHYFELTCQRIVVLTTTEIPPSTSTIINTSTSPPNHENNSSSAINSTQASTKSPSSHTTAGKNSKTPNIAVTHRTPTTISSTAYHTTDLTATIEVETSSEPTYPSPSTISTLEMTTSDAAIKHEEPVNMAEETTSSSIPVALLLTTTTTTHPISTTATDPPPHQYNPVNPCKDPRNKLLFVGRTLRWSDF